MRVQQIMDSVFANLAMKCIIRMDMEVGPQMATWLAMLHDLPNLHFDELPNLSECTNPSQYFDIMALRHGEPQSCAPPNHVFDVVPESQYWLAFDIETHDLAPSSGRSHVAWVEGQYGHPCRFQASSLNQLRIVQLGWCICKSIGQATVDKIRFVHPTDLKITKAAEMKHRITNDKLQQLGKPLRSVLEEFLHDVAAVVNMGGAICAHQIEFDAGIIALEIDRAGLENKQDLWTQSVSDGFCTMNHFVSNWSCRTYFDQVGCGSHLGRNAPVGLHDMVLALAPTEYKSLREHHDAGEDAKMTLKIAHALQHRLTQFR